MPSEPEKQLESMEMEVESPKQVQSKMLEPANHVDQEEVNIQTEESKISEIAAEVSKQEAELGKVETANKEELTFSDTSKDSHISELVADLSKAKESLGKAIEDLKNVSGQILQIENNLVKRTVMKLAKEVQLLKKPILPSSQMKLLDKVTETTPSHCPSKNELFVAQKKIEAYEKISEMLLKEEKWLEQDRQRKNLEAEVQRLNSELQLAYAKIRERDGIISTLREAIEEWPEVNRVDMQLFLSEILQEVRPFLNC